MQDRQGDQIDGTASIQGNLENLEKGTLRNSKLENPLLTVPYTLIVLHNIKLICLLWH